MFDEPPSVNRPTWNADTTVDPNENVSGSTSVRCWLVVLLYGSLLTWTRATLAAAGAEPRTRATAATRQTAVDRKGRRDITDGTVADARSRGNGRNRSFASPARRIAEEQGRHPRQPSGR